MESNSCLKDNPGIIILPNKKVVKTTKIKKWIDKHKPIEYSITYLEPIPVDFRDVERGLKELENRKGKTRRYISAIYYQKLRRYLYLLFL